jgi:hypothetical protein
MSPETKGASQDRVDSMMAGPRGLNEGHCERWLSSEGETTRRQGLTLEDPRLTHVLSLLPLPGSSEGRSAQPLASPTAWRRTLETHQDKPQSAS